MEIDGHLSKALQVRFGAGYEKTKITDPGALGIQGIGIESGSRILGTPAYSLANLRFGINHKQSEVSLNVHNLTNAKPNLGDIGAFDAPTAEGPRARRGYASEPLSSTSRRLHAFSA